MKNKALTVFICLFILLFAFPPQPAHAFVATLMTAIQLGIGFALGAMGVGALGAIATGIIVGISFIGALGILYGGVALSRSLASKKQSGLDSSPTYASPVLQTQTNNQLPVAIFDGERTLAGNMIWQDGTTTIKKLISFCEGEVQSITGIKLNDIAIEDIAGATYTVYLGTSTQQIDSRVTGSTNAERAEIVGSLKYIAYVAITVPKSDKIDINFNCTAYVKGRKIRQYTDENSYFTAYTRNPVWQCFDALTSYNGEGIGLKNDGTQDNDIIKDVFDIQSFIDAAAYCDAMVFYYQLTTNLTGNNNDLIFKARSSTDSDLTVTYVNPGTANATAFIELSGKNITVNLATNGSSVITTTASDIISLVNNNADVLALVHVYVADSNDGSGVVTAMTKTTFSPDDGSTRFACDLILDSYISTRDAIEEYKKNCRGCITLKGYKLQFKLDMPGTSVKVFTTEDIIKGSEKFWTIPREEHYDILTLNYTSDEHEYSKVGARAELATYQNEPGIEHEVDILSITNFEQAARQAWYYLNDKRLCPNFGCFQTDFRASDLEIGDIITLSDLLMGFISLNVKVVKVIDDNTGVFEVYWRIYSDDLYTDEQGSQLPTITQTKIVIEDKIRAATYVVAANNSVNKNQADFIVDDDSTSAQDTINNAINTVELQQIETGTVLTGCSTTSIILNTSTMKTDDYYNGLYIRFTSGNCAGEAAKLITDYVGSTQTATVQTFTNTPAANDTYEIQSFNAKILLMEGTYIVDNSILVKSGICLEGMGAGTVIKLKNNITSGVHVEFNIIQNSDITNGNSWISIKNLRIDGNIQFQDAFYTSVMGVYFEKVYNSLISNLLVSNIPYYGGIVFINSLDNKIISCTSNNNNATGIIVSSRSTVLNNICNGNGYFGMQIQGNNCTISNNICNYNGENGLYIYNGDMTPYIAPTNIAITSNMSSFNQWCGMFLVDISHSNISNNVCNENGCDGIYIGGGSGGNNNNISSNTCLQNSQENDYSSNISLVTSCNYNNIQNNILRSSSSGNIPAYGINIDASYGACVNNIVSNNDIKGEYTYGTASIYDSGTGTVKVNNRT